MSSTCEDTDSCYSSPRPSDDSDVNSRPVAVLSTSAATAVDSVSGRCFDLQTTYSNHHYITSRGGGGTHVVGNQPHYYTHNPIPVVSVTGSHPGGLLPATTTTHHSTSILSPAAPRQPAQIVNSSCVFNCSQLIPLTNAKPIRQQGGGKRGHNAPIPSVKLPEYPWVADTLSLKEEDERTACKSKKGEL